MPGKQEDPNCPGLCWETFGALVAQGAAEAIASTQTVTDTILRKHVKHVKHVMDVSRAELEGPSS